MGITELLNIVTVFSILLPAAAMVREKKRARSSNCWSAPCRRSSCVPQGAGDDAGDCAGAARWRLFGVLQLGFAVPVRGSAVLFCC